MGLPRIEDYGLLGDTRTAALVSDRGSVDWMCFPRFDSEPVFGTLVAGERGGSFALTVEDAEVERRAYVDATAVIETVHRAGAATVTATEGLVLDVRSELLPQALLVRELVCSGGTARIRIRFDPRAGWSGSPFRGGRRAGALVLHGRRLTLALVTSPDLPIRPGEELVVPIHDGDRWILALGLTDGHPAVLVDPGLAARHLRATADRWRAWGEDLEVGEVAPDLVRRSLLTLRLLTYAPSGAPVAAPTTSLPEVPGGDANWDYRFAWIRDASLGTGAFLGAGLRAEADAFLAWMLHAGRLTRPRLHVAYDVLGRVSTMSERTIDGLPGYAGSRPVRVGNEAFEQLQLDAYGWMLDAGWSLASAGGELVRETRRSMWGHADLIADRWREPDHGIWELRGEPRHYVHSKAMAWVALDRAIRLASRYRVGDRRVRRWAEERERVLTEIDDRGFDEHLGAYVQSFDGGTPDAAALLLPVWGLAPADDPRIERTIRAVRRELGAGGPLLYRFPPEGEGAFVACSFWLVQALAMAGRLEEADELFVETCRLATPLGLFAEEIDPATGGHVGNFPQALSHSALVQAAFALRAAGATAEGSPRGSPRTARARGG
jgi:GH15 family glucan-1,4-alpha-glucosidase